MAKHSGNAKLKVQFFWPFRGKYWIINLADDYSYAVVSEPKRNFLWVLSRTSTLPEETLNTLKADLKSSGFDLSRLKMTVQK